MTTAHRATFNPAVGGSEQGGNKLMVPTRQYSSKDLPGYTEMRLRTKEGEEKLNKKERREIKNDLRMRELEVENKRGKKSENFSREKEIDDDGIEYLQKRKKVTSSNKIGNIDLPSIQNRKRIKNEDGVIEEDEDDEAFLDDDEEESESEDEEEDEDLEEMKLLEEFERIKKQREQEEKQQLEEKYENLTEKEQGEILKGNPLYDSSYSLQKRWYEETVFRNQSKTQPVEKKRFINDTVRSDFHKKFLKKFVWT